MPPALPPVGTKPCSRNALPSKLGEIGLEAGHHERRRDRPQQRADLAAAEAGDAR